MPSVAPDLQLERTKRRICWVVSSEMTVRAFLRDQIREAADAYDVSVVVNTHNPRLLQELGLKATLRSLAIERKIAPYADVRALLALARLFRAERYALVHSISPKAGLLAMLAGTMAGVKLRLHTFTGQVWATRRGASRSLLKMVDRVLAASATQLLADSRSQREFLIEERIASPDKISVLASGSISGVDLGRFHPDALRRKQVRRELALPEDACLFLYLGRLHRDKGVLDLGVGFARASKGRPDMYLACVGPDEQNLRPLLGRLLEVCAARVRFVEYTTSPESFCAAADVMCLPSYREGFGLTILEAAACGIPALASRIYGVTDAVVDGVTGLLHAPGDVEAIVRAIGQLHDERALRDRLGAAALTRARSEFSSERMTREIMLLYARLLERATGAA